MPFIPVAKLDEIPLDAGILVETHGKDIALYRVDGQVYACSDVCPHQGASLSSGTLTGAKIVCPWHQWCFNVKDGSSPLNERLKIKTYEVKQEGDQILVLIEETS